MEANPQNRSPAGARQDGGIGEAGQKIVAPGMSQREGSEDTEQNRFTIAENNPPERGVSVNDAEHPVNNKLNE